MNLRFIHGKKEIFEKIIVNMGTMLFMCAECLVISVTLITSAFGGLPTTIWGTLSYTSKFQDSQIQVSI